MNHFVTIVKLVRRYLARVILEALDGQLVAAILDQLNLYLNEVEYESFMRSNVKCLTMVSLRGSLFFSSHPVKL